MICEFQNNFLWVHYKAQSHNYVVASFIMTTTKNRFIRTSTFFKQALFTNTNGKRMLWELWVQQSPWPLVSCWPQTAWHCYSEYHSTSWPALWPHPGLLNTYTCTHTHIDICMCVCVHFKNWYLWQMYCMECCPLYISQSYTMNKSKQLHQCWVLSMISNNRNLSSMKQVYLSLALPGIVRLQTITKLFLI